MRYNAQLWQATSSLILPVEMFSIAAFETLATLANFGVDLIWCDKPKGWIFYAAANSQPPKSNKLNVSPAALEWLGWSWMSWMHCLSASWWEMIGKYSPNLPKLFQITNMTNNSILTIAEYTGVYSNPHLGFWNLGIGLGSLSSGTPLMDRMAYYTLLESTFSDILKTFNTLSAWVALQRKSKNSW